MTPPTSPSRIRVSSVSEGAVPEKRATIICPSIRGNEGGALICLDFKTGNVLWNQRTEGRAPKGSIAFADHRFYYRCEDGTMLLFEPSAKEYLERGRFPQPDRSESPDWAHPVIANGKLYLRDQDVLLCYDVKAK